MSDNREKRKPGNDLTERLLNFAALIIKFINSLPRTIVGKYIAG